METRKRAMGGKQLAAVNALNKRMAKKKSNIKSRYGVVVEDVPKIDVNLKGKALKKQIEKVESFLNPNNTNYQYKKVSPTLTITKKEYNEDKRLIERANRIKQKEYNKLANMTYTAGGVVGKMKDVSPSKLAHFTEKQMLSFDLSKFTSRADYERWRKVKKEAWGGDFINRQRSTYKENYINAFINEFGDTTVTQKIKEQIEKLDINTFYMLSESRPQLEIKYIYDPQQADVILEKLRVNWQGAMKTSRVGQKVLKEWQKAEED